MGGGGLVVEFKAGGGDEGWVDVGFEQ